MNNIVNAIVVKASMLLLVGLLASVTSLAAEISAEQSRVAVESWMRKYGIIAGKSIDRIETIADSSSGAKMHLAVLRGGGFVVTAADDRVSPVMAYSQTGTFVNSKQNPLLWLLQADASAANEVFAAGSGTSPATRLLAAKRRTASVQAETRTDAQREWDELLGRTAVNAKADSGRLAKYRAVKKASSEPSATYEMRVKPIITTKWGQTTHNNEPEPDYGGHGLLCYNYFTPSTSEVEPADPSGLTDELVDVRTRNCSCGCVATAGAQVMKKWARPTRYAFADMPDDPAEHPSQKGREAIGRLTADIGADCDAVYGVRETSMALLNLMSAMKSRYSYAGAFYHAISGTDEINNMFEQQVIPNLIAGQPVLLGIMRSESRGHCVIADGLRREGSTWRIHMNVGWNGNYDIWYSPLAIHVGEYHYNSINEIGININPDKSSAIIAGRVAYAGGAEIRNATVALLQDNRQLATAKTDSFGQFYFHVAEGRYGIKIDQEGCDEVTESDIDVSCSDSSVSNFYKEFTLNSTAGTVELPAINPTGEDGFCYSISMSCATAGATIHYTVDGSKPTEADPEYNGAFLQYDLNGAGSMSIRAVAFKDGMKPSDTASVQLAFATAKDNTTLLNAAGISAEAGMLSLDNAFAAKEDGEPDHSVMGKVGGASMWVSFTAPENGDYTFAASGVEARDSGHSLDTQLAVYTGTSVGTLTFVAANDDVDASEYNFSSTVGFRAVKGMEYKIAVDTCKGEKGTIKLEWRKGREDVASPTDHDVYYTEAEDTYSITIRSTANWYVCDGSDWILDAVKEGIDSGADGESLRFKLPRMTESGVRRGVLILRAGDSGPSSSILITQGTTLWATRRSEAVEAAKAEGKRILMVCGLDSDSATSDARFTACEDASVRSLLQEGYVLWYCDYDGQYGEYSYYGYDLESFYLPLVCIVDPIEPDRYVARSTGRLKTEELRQMLLNNSESNLPTSPFEVHAEGANEDGTISVAWSPARRAQSYEVWRGAKWNPAEAVRIASDVKIEEYIDDTAEPSVLYYYRVRAVNGVGSSDFSAPAAGCWRAAGAIGAAAIGKALDAPHLDWTTEGDYKWTVQTTNTYDGVAAMQSAFTKPDQAGVESVLKTTVAGPAKMSFRYKTSMYMSRFTVKIDGTAEFLVTNDVPNWSMAAVDIPDGRHAIEFSYVKQGYYTSGFNGVYLDMVQFDVASVPPTLSPATTDSEYTAVVFTGAMNVSIAAPREGGQIYYTLNGEEPTTASQKYEGPFTITSSTCVKATCVQDGHDCSATVSGLYVERHPVLAGEWTTDVDGAKRAASENGSIIVTLLANCDNDANSRLFQKVAVSDAFLSWAKVYGVYLITADSSWAPDTAAAAERFWNLFADAGQMGSASYPALAISSARTPDKASGYAVALIGAPIGGVAYDGSAKTLEQGLKSFIEPNPTDVFLEFDPNGGSTDEIWRRQTRGQSIGTLPAATKNGYNFDGWFSVIDGGSLVGPSYSVAADCTLYAHWAPVSYAIQYELDGGVNAEGNPASYTVEQRVVLAAPTRPGYTFKGWTPDDGVINAGTTGDKCFTAIWELSPVEIMYTLTFDGNGGEVEPHMRSVRKGDAYGELPQPLRVGYDFGGWYTALTGGYRVAETTVANGDAMLYAYWVPKSYNIVYVLNGGDNAKDNPTAYTIESEITLLPPTRSGYLFSGWLPDGGKISKGSTGDKIFTAEWRKDGTDDPVTPDPVTPDPITPDPVTPDPVTPDPVTPDPVTPDPVTPDPVTPEVEEITYGGVVEDGSFSKVQTVRGALYDTKGNFAGTVELKFGKKGKKGVKISGSAMIMVGGKVKKISAKAVNLIMDVASASILITFKDPVGQMTFSIGDGRVFSLKGAKYEMVGAIKYGEDPLRLVSVGGGLAKSRMLFNVAMDSAPAFGKDGKLLDAALPTNMPISVFGGTKWSVDKAASLKYRKDKATGAYELTGLDAKNQSGLKLSYTAKTGQFKGSFKLYATNEETTPAGKSPKLKKYTVNVIGFVVDGVGCGEATLKKPAGAWAVTVE